MSNQNNAAKVVSSAIIGVDFRVVVVAGKRYVINPPTIRKIAGAAYYLSDIADAKTVSEIITNQDSLDNVSKALSFLIAGHEKLSNDLSKGTIQEVIGALRIAYEMVSAQDFTMLSGLARNVSGLTAKEKQ